MKYQRLSDKDAKTAIKWTYVFQLNQTTFSEELYFSKQLKHHPSIVNSGIYWSKIQS